MLEIIHLVQGSRLEDLSSILTALKGVQQPAVDWHLKAEANQWELSARWLPFDELAAALKAAKNPRKTPTKLARREAEMRARMLGVTLLEPIPAPPTKQPEKLPEAALLILDELYKDGCFYQTPKLVGKAFGWCPRTVIRDLRDDPDVQKNPTVGPVSGKLSEELRIPRISAERFLAKRLRGSSLSDSGLNESAPPRRPLRVEPLGGRNIAMS